MPTLYIVRGVPGSGKSTYARSLNLEHHYEADMYFEDDEGNYNFDPRRLKSAHNWCHMAVEYALEEGNDVVVANTFTRLSEVLPYVTTAVKNGAKVEVVTCDGDYGSVHNVPVDVINNMRRRLVPHDELLKIIDTYIEQLECGEDA